MRAFISFRPQRRSRVLSGSATSVFVVLIAACFFCPAQAGILVGDWKNSGDGLLTIDTTQGLEFLNLNMSFGRSFNDVSGQFGSGGDFEGFRFATEQEAVNLINEIGWSGTPAFVAGGFSRQAGRNTAEAIAIQALLGVRSAGGGGFGGGPGGILASSGMTSTSVAGGQRIVEVFRFRVRGNDFARAILSASDSAMNAIVGSFLVRSNSSASPPPPPGGGNPGGGIVPEPSSFAMFALAGIGLVGARRRKN